MEYVMVGLLAFALILLIISAFLKDPYKIIREEIDQLSMQQIQEMYVIKKKLKVLEEELLVGDEAFHPSSSIRQSFPSEKKEIHEIIKNQVWSLAQQGLTVDQISRQSSLSPNEVETILSEMIERGQRYE
ncbi:hypothetical protein [Cytobacillus praedii]|uniref:DUF2802 domain-containing protein n=1 Tax=Cytobacillus praedii TaxID=1742358 RepID=A0A4R1AZH1_9BACI|nr:hypothetical protein [Cytobacillus praedii]MED3548989.1 hypothetical protein [Cytobacillus praedii]TCJ04169.1 hypothetical protein E0Y62_10435 [Cytobacillus praedii]